MHASLFFYSSFSARRILIHATFCYCIHQPKALDMPLKKRILLISQPSLFRDSLEYILSNLECMSSDHLVNWADAIPALACLCGRLVVGRRDGALNAAAGRIYRLGHHLAGCRRPCPSVEHPGFPGIDRLVAAGSRSKSPSAGSPDRSALS